MTENRRIAGLTPISFFISSFGMDEPVIYRLAIPGMRLEFRSFSLTVRKGSGGKHEISLYDFDCDVRSSFDFRNLKFWAESETYQALCGRCRE